MDRIYGHGTKLGMITFSQIIDLVLKIRWFTFISQFRCFVGKRHLEEAMKAFSNNLHFEVTWKPFFLNPTTPDTGVPLDQYLTRKYGPRVAAQAKEGTSPLSRAGMNVVITCTIVIDIFIVHDCTTVYLLVWGSTWSIFLGSDDLWVGLWNPY